MNRIGQPGPADEFLDEPVDLREPQAPNPLWKIHQLLRGGTCGHSPGRDSGGAGAWALYHLPIVQPTFTSPASYRSNPPWIPCFIRPRSIRALPIMISFLSLRLPILKSQRIILQAMALKKDQLAEMDRADLDQSLRLKAWDDKTWPTWPPIWDPSTIPSRSRAYGRLDVTHPRNTQVLQISSATATPPWRRWS